jgi:UDP-N-acetylglucosamine 2-epimerase (non-hydrolysing)
VNRRLVTHIADLHFAPTARSRENLLREGIGREQILVTGNTGIDALLWVSALLDARAGLSARFEAVLPAHKRVILMTGHRRESFEGGLERICSAVARIALRSDVAVVFPVHRNPNVRRAIEPLRGNENILLVEPVDYPEAMELGLAKLVGTDERRLFDEMSMLLDDPAAYSRMHRVENPYGDGHASRRIAERLIAGDAKSALPGAA